MIEVLKDYLKGRPEGQRASLTREYLQIACLKIIYDHRYFENLAFVGGTCLRVLFDLKRFSEDLDFSLIEKKGYDFRAMNDFIVRDFGLLGLTVESKPKTENNVHGTILKFSGLMKPLGLSELESQKLSIKFEIDTNPPKGGHLQDTVVNKVQLLNIRHFDLSSMFATKLHACFYRKYVKGRDFYDFVWYMSKKVIPNFELLNNAIEQTQKTNPAITRENFKQFLLGKIETIDFSLARKDVERFLEDPGELRLIDKPVLAGMIEQTY